ncbi:ribosomal protein S18-alanine N-acetyltransferase [Lutibacter sp. B2]|nr:ribosomal protein S18-alanine N-acetyltransferase [Lutibacter sp. B2]
MKFNLRRMGNEDIDAVVEVEKKCFKDPWSKESFKNEMNNNPLARYVVVEEEGEIVGYGGVWIIVDEGHITNIAVYPDKRRRGYAKEIVKGLIDLACKEDVYNMTLEVRKSNVDAQDLYEKYGFENCGIRPKYYEDNGEDAVIMWKR